VGNDLNPVSIRVVDEGNVLLSVPLPVCRDWTHPHLTLLGPLLELDSLLVEPLDSSFEVIDSNTNMSETFSNIVVSRSVSLEGVILLCSSVPHMERVQA